jgi:hypothetical protein
LTHLAAYCTHFATEQLIKYEVEALPRPTAVLLRSRLLKDARDETKLALDLARSSRLTLHAQRTAQTAGTASRAALKLLQTVAAGLADVESTVCQLSSPLHEAADSLQRPPWTVLRHASERR